MLQYICKVKTKNLNLMLQKISQYRYLKLTSLGLILFGAFIILAIGSGTGTTSHPEQKPATDNSAPVTLDSNKINKDNSHNNSYTGHAEPVSGSDKISTKRSEQRKLAAGSSFQANNRSFPLIEYEALAAPNDTWAVQDWTNDTNLQTAWDIGAGATPTTIAIIDSGFSLQHQEFTDRWLENTAEQGPTASENSSVLNCTDQSIALDASCNLIDDDFDAIVDNESGAIDIENPSRLNCTDQSIALDKSCNLIDDDSNGYVDDALGWDFVNYDRSVEAGETNGAGDTTGHATMVSGIAAATGNNNVGIAGVNWNSKILPLQVIDDDGYGNTLTLSRAIQYAVDQGVDVINLSLGSESNDLYLKAVIDQAIDAGVVIVASSGNDSCNCIRYPANFPEVVSVGAVNQSGVKSSFSNSGANLDIVAPGENMRSAVWVDGSTSTYVTGINGTSFSAPIVSGLLALAKTHQPDATWGELVGVLTQEANKSMFNSSTYRSNDYGFGRLDAGASMTRVTTVVSDKQESRLGPQLVDDPLGTYRLKTCNSGEKAGTTLHELSKSGSYRYTVSDLTKSDYVAAGWSSRTVGYGCVSIPTDTPEVIRTINLLQEIKNLSPKYGF